jgi:hypothetical protein
MRHFHHTDSAAADISGFALLTTRERGLQRHGIETRRGVRALTYTTGTASTERQSTRQYHCPRHHQQPMEPSSQLDLSLVGVSAARCSAVVAVVRAGWLDAGGCAWDISGSLVTSRYHCGSRGCRPRACGGYRGISDVSSERPSALCMYDDTAGDCIWIPSDSFKSFLVRAKVCVASFRSNVRTRPVGGDHARQEIETG